MTDISGSCCCCGIKAEKFQFGHWWCFICEGRGHNNEAWAKTLGESHESSEDCRRLWQNFLEDLSKDMSDLNPDIARDALKAIAGEADSCGHSHGSILHDIGKVVEFVTQVLKGRDPHEVLREMGG